MAMISERNLFATSRVGNCWRPIIPDIVGRKLCVNRNNAPQSYLKGTVPSALMNRNNAQQSYLKGTMSSALKRIQPEKITGHVQQIQPFYVGVSKTKHDTIMKPSQCVPRRQSLSPQSRLTTASKCVQFAVDISTDIVSEAQNSSKSQRCLQSEKQIKKKSISVARSDTGVATPRVIHRCKKEKNNRTAAEAPTSLLQYTTGAETSTGDTKVLFSGTRKKKRKKSNSNAKKKKRMVRKVAKKTKTVIELNRAKVKVKSDSIRGANDRSVKNIKTQPSSVKQSVKKVSLADKKSLSNSVSSTFSKSLNIGSQDDKSVVKNKTAQANIDNLPSLIHQKCEKTMHTPIHVTRIENTVMKNARKLAAARKFASDASRNANTFDKCLLERSLPMFLDQPTAEAGCCTEQNIEMNSKNVCVSGCESKKSLESVYLDEVRAKIAKTKGKVAIEPSHISVVSHKTRSTESVYKERRLSQTRQQLGLSPLVTPSDAMSNSQNDVTALKVTRPSRKNTTIKSGGGLSTKSSAKAKSLLMTTQLKSILANYDNFKQKETETQNNVRKTVTRSKSKSKKGKKASSHNVE